MRTIVLIGWPKKLYLILSIFIFVQTSFSQFINLKHYSENNGLIASGIKQIAIDRYNNLFLVSNHNHLLIFNGKEFKEYALETNSDVNLFLLTDNLGVLWIVQEQYSMNRIIFGKLEIDQFPKLSKTTYTYPIVIHDLGNVEIYTKAGMNFLFILSNDSLHTVLLSEKSLKLQKIEHYPGTTSISTSPKGLLICSGNKAELFAPNQNGIIERSFLHEKAFMFKYFHEFKAYLKVFENQLKIYDSEMKLQEEYYLDPNLIKSLGKHSFNFYLTNEYIYAFNIDIVIQINRKTRAKTVLTKTKGFITSGVHQITMDLQGNVWFAHEQGISKLPNILIEQSNVFENFYDKEVSSIEWFGEKNKWIFIGSNFKYVILNANNFSVQHVGQSSINYTESKYHQKNPRILDAVEINESVFFLWKGIGLIKLQEKHGVFKESKINLNNFSIKVSASIYYDKLTKILYIVSANTLVAINPETHEEIKRYVLNDNKFIGRKIFGRNNNELLILGVYGIWKLNLQSGKSELIEKEQSYYGHLVSKRQGAEFIVGSKGVFQIRNDKFFKEKINISGSVYSILEDKFGRLLLGTNKGLIFWNRTEDWLEEIGYENGLLGIEVNRSAFKISSNGLKLLVGTNKGINVVDLNSNLAIVKIPLYFESFMVNGTLSETSQKSFKHGSSLLFHLGFSNYLYAARLKYCYRIKNGLNQWVELNSPQIVLNELSPGSYDVDFVVKNGLNDVSNIINYKFEITVPWYRNNIFFVILIFLTISGLVVFFLLRLKRLAKSSENKNYIIALKKQVLENKLASLRAQINPHFINNLMNKIRIKLSGGQALEAASLITEYAHIMRYAFENTQQDFVCLEDEIEFYKQYLNLEKTLNGINHEIRVEKSLLEEVNKLFIPSMLIQPIIENAGKHAFKIKNADNWIKIHIGEAENGRIVILIIDNGIGFKKLIDRERASGLSVTQNRIEYYNELNIGEYSVNISQNSKYDETGVVVEFILPKRYTKFVN